MVGIGLLLLMIAVMYHSLSAVGIFALIYCVVNAFLNMFFLFSLVAVFLKGLRLRSALFSHRVKTVKGLIVAAVAYSLFNFFQLPAYAVDGLAKQGKTTDFRLDTTPDYYTSVIDGFIDERKLTLSLLNTIAFCILYVHFFQSFVLCGRVPPRSELENVSRESTATGDFRSGFEPSSVRSPNRVGGQGARATGKSPATSSRSQRGGGAAGRAGGSRSERDHVTSVSPKTRGSGGDKGDGEREKKEGGVHRQASSSGTGGTGGGGGTGAAGVVGDTGKNSASVKGMNKQSVVPVVVVSPPPGEDGASVSREGKGKELLSEAMEGQSRHDEDMGQHTRLPNIPSSPKMSHSSLAPKASSIVNPLPEGASGGGSSSSREARGDDNFTSIVVDKSSGAVD